MVVGDQRRSGDPRLPCAPGSDQRRATAGTNMTINIAVTYAALPDWAVQKNSPDLSVLTNEELHTLERIASKVSNR